MRHYFWLCLAAPTLVFAGMPDLPNPNQRVEQQQLYIADTLQTVTEQAIPKSDVLKALLWAIIDDIGPVKSLLWLACLPLCGIAAVVFGALKVLRRGKP